MNSAKMLVLAFVTACAAPGSSIVTPRATSDYLFIDDAGLNAVEIVRVGSWEKVGRITKKINDPHEDWFAGGRLYVANYDTGNIAEYTTGGTLTFIYSMGMQHPAVVTTDSSGNVYEGDYTGKFVNEYLQDSNEVAASCSAGGLLEGIAVDKAADVFVAYYDGEGTIAEYAGGLRGCKATKLGATVSFPGGLVLDDDANLIVVDQLERAVDIVRPPYNRVSGKLGSGYNLPFQVTIDATNGLAYVTDYGAKAVDVLDYPSGTKAKTLNAADGLSQPLSAVASNNYVP